MGVDNNISSKDLSFPVHKVDNQQHLTGTNPVAFGSTVNLNKKTQVSRLGEGYDLAWSFSIMFGNE